LVNVKRDNQQDKIEDFFDRSDFLMQEMEHREELAHGTTFSWFAKREQIFRNWSFSIAILINLLIITFYTVPERTEVTINEFNVRILPYPEVSFPVWLLIVTLGMAQIVLSTITFFIFSQFNGTLILRQAWRKHSDVRRVATLVLVLVLFVCVRFT